MTLRTFNEFFQEAFLARRDDKYGSSYDPRNGGKIQRPTAQEEAARAQREREEHQLRGCGNPACPMCNPETVGATTIIGDIRRATVTLMDPPGGYGMPNFVELSAAMREAMMRPLQDELYRAAGMERPSSQGSTPPQSFTAARDAVKQWIVPAPETAFEDIIGNDEALGLLRDAIEAPVKHKALYEAYGMKTPKGALLSGPPGCGKTMFAKAAASAMKRLYGGEAEFINLGAADLQSMFIGETEKRITQIFDFAREYLAFRKAPLLVFIDEAETLFPDRTGRVRRVASWEESQVATLLAEMDGMKVNGAFVLLATNRPEVMDQALLRDGRCDFKIAIRRPTPEAARAILERAFAETHVREAAREDLVSAAFESLYDPHKVILTAQQIRVDFAKRQITNPASKHFLLEHIISGAMCASIPARATRHAFARDKASGGAPTGVTVADVVAAVNDLFAENKGLDHSFALREFDAAFRAELGEIAGGGGEDS